MTKASNKAVVVANTEATASAPATVVKAPVKADKAREIFAEAYATSPVPQRKDIIARCVAEAGLTKAGAATYLQIYKDKNGLSVKKGTVAATA